MSRTVSPTGLSTEIVGYPGYFAAPLLDLIAHETDKSRIRWDSVLFGWIQIPWAMVLSPVVFALPAFFSCFCSHFIIAPTAMLHQMLCMALLDPEVIECVYILQWILTFATDGELCLL